MFWQMASMWQLSVPSTHSSTSARGEAGGSDGESPGGSSPRLPMGAIARGEETKQPSGFPTRQAQSNAAALLRSGFAIPSPDAPGDGLAAGQGEPLGPLPNSPTCVPALRQAALRLPDPFVCLMIGNTAQAPVVQAGASPGRGESLCLQLAVS